MNDKTRAGMWSLSVLVLTAAFHLPEEAAAAPPLRGSTEIHDPSSIVSCDGRYYTFGTGRGIVSKSSADKVFWVDGPPVFAAPPAWVPGAAPRFNGDFWAPDVIFRNGQYHLYYSVSSWASQESAIGLATSPTLDPAAPDYQWTDQGIVIQSEVGSPYNTIDPGITVDADGRPWMVFGSYWTGIYLVELDPLTGQRIDPDSPLYNLAYNPSIEAACIYYAAPYYYLFVNWGSCCSGVNSTYHIRVGRSSSITGPYLDRDGIDLLSRGGTLFMETSGKFAGPGHLGILRDGGAPWVSYHYYDAGAYSTRYGAYGVANIDLRPLEMTDDGWPYVENDWSAIYRFDADARDENGQYYGMLEGGASIQNDAERGRVLDLSGNGQAVRLPPGVANARTFVADLKWDGGAAGQRIFDFGVDTLNYVMLTPSSGDGRLRCEFRPSRPVQALEWTHSLPTGVWTRVAATFDGSRGVLYIDGAPVATNENMTRSPFEIRSQVNYLGRSKFTADPYFHGQIASFHAYGRVLSPEEIAALPGDLPGDPPAQAWASYYPFTRDASDAQGPFDGTLAGGASITNDPDRGPVADLSGADPHLDLPAGSGAWSTFSGWVKWNGGAVSQRIFHFGAGDHQWVYLTPRNPANRFRCALTTDSSEYVRVIEAPGPLPSNQWIHVAVVLDGRQGILYTNGQAAAVNNSVNLLPSDVGATHAWLGRSPFPADPYFNGRLDAIRLNARPLSLLEIAAPTLRLSLSHTDILLSLPAWASGFHLQGAPTLLPPVSWSPVTNAWQSGPDLQWVSLPAGEENHFYRLQSP